MTQSPEPDLERVLTAIDFEPRPSLGPEILGRWRRGESSAPRTNLVRRMLGIGVAGAGILAFLLADGTPGLHPAVTVDRCCQDLDGGGDADDGILVVARDHDHVVRLAVYEDRDRSRSLTPGDVVRFERRGRPSVMTPLDSSLRTHEFCCKDYDGDGPADDVLVVLTHPPDYIALAAIYERSHASPELR